MRKLVQAVVDYFKTGRGEMYRSWIALYFLFIFAVLGAFILGMEVIKK